MHEFFAGSGLVAYGLRGMFAPVWANDISEQKAAVYEANFGCERFVLDDIKNIKGVDLPFAHLSWASFPCQDLSLAGSIGGIHASRSGCLLYTSFEIVNLQLSLFLNAIQYGKLKEIQARRGKYGGKAA